MGKSSAERHLVLRLAGKLTGLRTERYLREWAARADRARTLAILERAGRDNPPLPGDEPT